MITVTHKCGIDIQASGTVTPVVESVTCACNLEHPLNMVQSWWSASVDFFPVTASYINSHVYTKKNYLQFNLFW